MHETQKKPNILFRLLKITFGVGLLYILIVFCLICSSRKNRSEEVAENIIVPGAQVRGDPAYPSPVLKERLNAALAYLQTSPHATIVVCGGQGADESATEASVMAAYLIERGVPEAQIRLEETSTRTKENLENALTFLSPGKTVIVTNDYHMFRTKLLAKRVGITEVHGYAAPSETTAKIPNHIREIAALGYGLIMDW